MRVWMDTSATAHKVLSIAVGARADLLFLDESLVLQQTLIAGKRFVSVTAEK